MLRQTLPKKPVDGMRALAAAQDVERLRLAMAGAGEAAFDWTLADDHIQWDGATNMLASHTDPDRLARGEALRAWMSANGRDRLGAMLRENTTKDSTFEIEFEAASAMGNVWFEMSGVRISGAEGRAERLTGILRVITERKREAQRLTYLATRDELTGHLNRTSLREKLSQAIEAAKAEERNCAYLVASIDRLAMINEA